MINFNNIKKGDYLLYNDYIYKLIWLGEITHISTNFDNKNIYLKCIYSNAKDPYNEYILNNEFDKQFWTIPSEQQLNYYLKLKVFE